MPEKAEYKILVETFLHQMFLKGIPSGTSEFSVTNKYSIKLHFYLRLMSYIADGCGQLTFY